MQGSSKDYVYQAPAVFVFLFYLVLSAWTVISILFMALKYQETGKADMTQVLIFAFLFGITWYFSLGISYRIEMDGGGTIRLLSFRRVIQTQPKGIGLIQGPLLPVGFLRFRLEREKAYLFCIATDKALHEILSAVRSRNPDMEIKSL